MVFSISDPESGPPSVPPSVRIAISRLPGTEDLPLPSRQSPGSAGYDLHAAVESPVSLAPGRGTSVPTGLRIALPPGFEGQVRPRSGLAVHHAVGVLNAPGTIDSDYRGEIRVLLFNFGTEPFEVRRGERIAQLVVARVESIDWVLSTDLEGTERGEGGFGHTGR